MTMTADRPDVQLRAEPAGRAQRPADVRKGAAAVQQGQGLHQGRRGADQRRVPSAGRGPPDVWQYAPGQLEVLEAAKDKAKAAGLWNFFLPNAETGEGLSNLDYAYIAVELGKNRLASEIMNCAAPDTGNMEVLERVGTPEQKKQWLEPLLPGRSARPTA